MPIIIRGCVPQRLRQETSEEQNLVLYEGRTEFTITPENTVDAGGMTSIVV